MDDANKIVGVITYDQIVEHVVHDFMLERTIKERRSVGASTTIEHDPFETWGAFCTSTPQLVTLTVTEVSIIVHVYQHYHVGG